MKNEDANVFLSLPPSLSFYLEGQPHVSDKEGEEEDHEVGGLLGSEEVCITSTRMVEEEVKSRVFMVVEMVVEVVEGFEEEVKGDGETGIA